VRSAISVDIDGEKSTLPQTTSLSVVIRKRPKLSLVN